MKYMIMNYKPYEYELLLDKLNKLGKERYLATELSFFTTFKKVKQPIHYKIDFYRPEGQNKRDKEEDSFAFIERYRLKGYNNIYNKHNMYVFYTTHKSDPHIDWEMKDDIVKHSFRLLSLLQVFISIVAFSMIIYYSLDAYFDKFRSYGILIAFVGFLLSLVALAYRGYINFYGMTIFNSRIKKRNPHLNINKLEFLRKPYFIIMLISVICMMGGLIEDTFNARSFSIKEHPIMTLKDFDINKKSTIDTQKYSGFIVPHTYITFEKADKNGLYIKEYEYHSQDKAKHLFNQFKQLPHLYGATKTKVDDNVIYGYNQDSITSLVIYKDKSVIMFLPAFDLTDTNTQKIIAFYK